MTDTEVEGQRPAASFTDGLVDKGVWGAVFVYPDPAGEAMTQSLWNGPHATVAVRAVIFAALGAARAERVAYVPSPTEVAALALVEAGLALYEQATS